MVWKLLIVTASAALLAAANPALAADPVLPSASSRFALTSNGAVVDQFHAGRKDAPMWLRDAAAVDQLLGLLRTSTIDGFAAGPALAAEADALLVRARAGDAAAAKSAERLMSSAYLRYIEVLYAPVQGVIYGDNYVRPRVPAAAYSLQQAARAPSLAVLINEVTRVNPMRGELRAAALREAALPGGGQSAMLIANMDRARMLPATGRFVMVDVPSARLWMYENGQAVDSMKVVVGKNEIEKKSGSNLQTPMIASVMYYTIFNPYWHVPDHLVRLNIAPAVVKIGVNALKGNKYEVVDAWSSTANVVDPSTVDWKAVAAGTVHVKLRQKPSGENSMGKMKFPFPNPEGIFLHDTNHKDYFKKADRTLSNGCIRLEDAQRFGRWLNRGPSAAENSNAELAVAFPQGVPVYVTYLTARPEAGKIAYAPDVYGKDKAARGSAVALSAN